MKTNKLIYWIATGLMCLLFLFSAGMYLLNYPMVVEMYQDLNFPAWIIYPSAIAKVLGVIAILSRKSTLLKEWAYAGFFFDMALATAAHLVVADGAQGMAMVGLVLVVISRYFDTKVFA